MANSQSPPNPRNNHNHNHHHHHQISISTSPVPSIDHHTPYSDHSPTSATTTRHRPNHSTNQNQLDQDVQAALHFSRARAGTLDLSAQSPPPPPAEQQQQLWSNQDLLTGSANEHQRPDSASPTQPLFIEIQNEHQSDFHRRPPSDNNSTDSSHGAFIDHRPPIQISNSPAQQPPPPSSAASNLLISPSLDNQHHIHPQPTRYPSETHHPIHLHSTPPSRSNPGHLLDPQFCPATATRPISDPSRSNRHPSLRDHLRRQSPDPSPHQTREPVQGSRTYSQGSIHSTTNRNDHHRLFHPSSHDSCSATSPRPSQAEQDVCFPRLDADRPLLDQRHPSMGSHGPVPQTTTTAGMLPHFPFPFNFQALEEFAQTERETLEVMKSRRMLQEPYRDSQMPGFPGSRLRRVADADDLPSPEDELLGEDPSMVKDGVRRRKIGFLPPSVHHESGSGRNTSGEGDEENRMIGQRRLGENARPLNSTKRKLALFEGTGLGSFSLGSQTEGSAISGGIQKDGRAPLIGSKGRFPGAQHPNSHEARPGQVRWANPAERPYRFSFYSNALPSTIHARSLAEIPGEGQTFEDLFVGRVSPHTPSTRLDSQQPFLDIPVPSNPELAKPDLGSNSFSSSIPNPNDLGLLTDAQIASAGGPVHSKPSPDLLSNLAPPPDPKNLKPRSGVLLRTDEDAEASTWWLDVLSPTDQEMKLLSKVFGIHPLTTEDIQMEETREKIELFRNYYLVCFRSFDQDPYSPTYLEPLNIYIIVFREGTLSFHFRATPHPQNVRRRIKQLKDYINVTSDWISYALIDDITDAFGPLIQGIEYEVDSIDELVLILKDVEQSDMLRRIGTCRKKVMGLLRLMGNKADVVKGLAKRCNENWTVAPKSDIGLYLSDIQDHLVTMTQNLNHYEKILSRSHSNYLAQISIEMTDANNQINDVLSKLTALGSILVPMNLVTGLWGMNVHVPGQDITEGYAWFIAIVCALVSFGVVGAWLTLRYFKFSNH